MQFLSDMADRIKKQAKEKNVSVKKLLINTNLGPNTVSKIANGGDLLSQSLVKIADYLDCSVDYLLGRSNNSQSHKIKGNDNVSGNYNAVDNSNSVTISTPSLDEHKKLLLELYNKLSPIEQVELLSNLNKRTSSNKNDNEVESVYKVARAASGVEESPGGIVQITKEKLDLLETAPESEIE